MRMCERCHGCDSLVRVNIYPVEYIIKEIEEFFILCQKCHNDLKFVNSEMGKFYVGDQGQRTAGSCLYELFQAKPEMCFFYRTHWAKFLAKDYDSKEELVEILKDYNKGLSQSIQEELLKLNPRN